MSYPALSMRPSLFRLPGYWMAAALAVIWASCVPVRAEDFSQGIPGPAVQRLVEQALNAAGEPSGAVLAPVMSYPPCNGTPSVGPHDGNWTTAEVQCSDPVWSRLVRTQVPQQVAALTPSTASASGPMHPAVTLSHPVAKGAVLTAADLTLAEVSAQTTEMTFSDPAQVIGRSVALALPQGTPLQPRHLATDFLVRKNGPVTISAEGGGFAIGMAGQSEADGALGDVVSVRNLSSGREIQAIVTARETVVVPTNIP